jgi:hypothetical protein
MGVPLPLSRFGSWRTKSLEGFNHLPVRQEFPAAIFRESRLYRDDGCHKG